MKLATFLAPNVHPGICWATTTDYPAMAAIDRASFGDPWSVDDLDRVLRQNYHMGILVKDHGRILGFAIYELRPDKINLLRLAVDPGQRLQGVGRRLIAKLVGKLTAEMRTRLEIHVRERNLDTQIFLRRRGFLATGVVRGHFRDTGEDAFVMSYQLEKE